MGKFIIQILMWLTWFFVSRFLYLHTNYDLVHSIMYGFFTIFALSAVVGIICVCIFGICTINYQIGGNDSGGNDRVRGRDVSYNTLSGTSLPTEYEMEYMLPQRRPAISVVNK
jgi:hypothetical protein